MTESQKLEMQRFVSDLLVYPYSSFDFSSFAFAMFPEVNQTTMEQWLTEKKTHDFLVSYSGLFLSFNKERYDACMTYCSCPWSIEHWAYITDQIAMFKCIDGRVFINAYVFMHFLHFVYPREITTILQTIESVTSFDTIVEDYVSNRAEQLSDAAVFAGKRLEEIIYHFWSNYTNDSSILNKKMDDEWNRIVSYLTSYSGIY